MHRHRCQTLSDHQLLCRGRAADDRRGWQGQAGAGRRIRSGAYLRRAGIDVPAPTDPPGPWAPTLAGRWHEAADAWTTPGERYEAAVVRPRRPIPVPAPAAKTCCAGWEP